MMKTMNQLQYSEAVDRLTGLKTPQYKTVDTQTAKGIKQAERLHRAGWKIGRNGFFSIQFYKP